MGRRTSRQQLVHDARDGRPVQRVEVPKTICPRCSSEVYALPSGEPRPHLRAAVQGDPGWSEIVPGRVTCD